MALDGELLKGVPAHRTRGRYHVLHTQHGACDWFARKHEAFECAVRVANATQDTYRVFDAMAKRGAPQLWEVPPGHDVDDWEFRIIERRAS